MSLESHVVLERLEYIGKWSPYALSFGREGYTLKVWKIATQWQDETLGGVIAQAFERVVTESTAERTR